MKKLSEVKIVRMETYYLWKISCSSFSILDGGEDDFGMDGML